MAIRSRWIIFIGIIDSDEVAGLGIQYIGDAGGSDQSVHITLDENETNITKNAVKTAFILVRSFFII